MRGLLLFVALALVACASASDIDLDQSNFQSTIDANPYVLAMFYAPWCGHCKTLKPKFTEAAGKVAGKYVLAKIDCTLETAKELCQEFGVRGYPTVKFFKKGVPQDYTGPREVDGIISWLDKKTGPTVVDVASEADLAAFVKQNAVGDAVVVAGRFDAVGSPAQKQFAAAADDADMEGFKFVQVIGKAGPIELYARGEQPIVFGPNEDGNKLAKWAFEQHFALVDEVGGHNFAKYAKLGKPLHLVFVDPSDAEKDTILAALRTVASEHRDESFSWIDAQKYRAQIKGMGASGDVVPCIIKLTSFGSDNKPVVFEKPLTLDSLRDFAVGAKTGKYKYVPKSEAIPEDNSGPVKVVVGKTFDEIVNDDTKDVLVEYYAPWCGHCKTLAPKYEELGKAFAKVSGVTIAKIDGTANDVESHAEIKGFPTLLFYKSNDKKNPVPYNGDREVAAMAAFIKQHTTTKWNKEDL